jgi:hypothetical protein
MVVNCNKESLKELVQNIMDGKVKQFTIEERLAQDRKGEFNAEIEYLNVPVKVDLEFRMHNADILNEFAEMLDAGKVERFFMHYNIEGKKSIVSKAFKDQSVALIANAANDIIVEDFETVLTKALTLVGDYADKSVPELTKKIKREGGQKPLFKEVKVAEALNAVLKVVKSYGNNNNA